MSMNPLFRIARCARPWGLVGVLLCLMTSLRSPALAQVEEGWTGAAIGATILVTRTGEALALRPLYTTAPTRSPAPDSLTYTFTVVRTGGSTSRVQQSGTFTPLPGIPDTLTTSRINARPGDRLELSLVIRHHGHLRDSVERTLIVPP